MAYYYVRSIVSRGKQFTNLKSVARALQMFYIPDLEVCGPPEKIGTLF